MATPGTPGASTAPSSYTVYYDNLLSTTMYAYKKQLFDNIFKDSAFLAYLRLSDAVQRQNGGERIAMPLMYETNSTVETHSGYSIIDTTPQDGITTAFYEWAEIAGTISISRREERQNAGEGRILSLLEAKVQQAEMSMTEKLNTDLIQGSTGGAAGVEFQQDTADDGNYGLNPLGYFLPEENSTNAGTLSPGTINRATYSWWRHNTASLGAGADGDTFNLNVSTFAGMKVGLRRMYNYCSRGTGGSPNLVVADQLTYETYENALDTNMRYQNTQMADMGFDTIKLRGATCIWDESVPDIHAGSATLTNGTAFFINTKFYKLIIDSETDLTTTPFVTPENQTVRTAKLLFMGQACVSNMRKHGVCFETSLSIVA